MVQVESCIPTTQHHVNETLIFSLTSHHVKDVVFLFMACDGKDFSRGREGMTAGWQR